MAKLGKHWCYVTDMARSTAFFRSVFQLEPKFESSHWTEFDFGNGILALHLGDEGGAGGWTAGINVDDLRAVKSRAENAGASFEGEFHQTPLGVVLTIHDPDGNRIQALQPGSKLEEF